MRFGYSRAVISIVLFSLAGLWPSFATGQTRTRGNALPGSPTYLPTKENPVGWRGDGTGRYPAADPPTVWGRRKTDNGFEAKNIIWAARMPAVSVATPIIVGDRIFATAEVNDLVCIDKKTGRILWIRSNSEFEGLSDEDRKAAPELGQTTVPLIAEMASANDEMVAACNAGDNKKIDALADKKKDLDKHMYEALLKVNKKKFNRDWAQAVFGFSGPTPTSDGKHVFVFYTTGVVACYDLDGKRKWIDRGHGDGSEHGNFASPLLIANRLVVWGGEMRGYDADSGKIVFNNPGKKGNTYGSLFRIKAGNEWVAGFQSGYFTRISDGKPIWGDQIFGDCVPTPIVENGMIFTWLGYPRGNHEKIGFKAFPIIPATNESELKSAYMFKIDWNDDELPEDKKLHPFDRSYTASPLYVDGLIYQLTQGGGLTVNDAATGDLVYRKVLKLHPFTEYWNWAGASACPTLAGKYIYLMDNQGATIVIKPGRNYVEVAQNMIENPTDGKHQDQNLATPIFEGARMYYRTRRELLCIGTK
ncbi:MAG TPA: PQQ-binding-like beta-propeller repeat protein [Tepidisphaeraceae bacterium]|jgi:outer membrane protein assembly factor BamB|nr:PQQ-binding-like beta-propeller repeat protein [Tepidisphaeraceae bacterium]